MRHSTRTVPPARPRAHGTAGTHTLTPTPSQPPPGPLYPALQRERGARATRHSQAGGAHGLGLWRLPRDELGRAGRAVGAGAARVPAATHDTAMPALGWRGYTAPSAQNKSVHNRWAAHMPGVGAGRWFSCVRGTRRASPSSLHHVAARSVSRQAPLPCTTLSAREGDVHVRVCVLSERGPSACQRCQRPQSCCLNVSPVRSCLRRRAHVLRGARASGWTGSALPQARFGAHFICDRFTCHGGVQNVHSSPWTPGAPRHGSW